MLRYTFILSLVIFFSSCKKDKDASVLTSANTVTLIHPSKTDSKYSSSDYYHYVVRNNLIHKNKLLIFLSGSFSAPKNYDEICGHAAALGLDVINVAYPNKVTVLSLSESMNELVFDNFREEICYGVNKSSRIDVDVLNSIYTRTVKLLQYLDDTYPDQRWGQYLTTSNTPVWDRIIVAGHSQGAGHACYLGKTNLVSRVVMFSGPNDYSTYFNAPGNWLKQNGLTALKKHYALLHENDQRIAFDYQVQNLRGLNLLAEEESPMLIEESSTFYQNKNALSVNFPDISPHGATVGDNELLPDIWTYMLMGK